MLKTVLDSYDQLIKTTSTNKMTEQISYGLLKDLVELLEPLKIIRKQFSIELSPTFHLVSVSYDRIMEMMQLKLGENQIVLLLKKLSIRSMKEKFVVRSLHVIASFISPCF